MNGKVPKVVIEVLAKVVNFGQIDVEGMVS